MSDSNIPLPPTALAPEIQILDGPAADTALAALRAKEEAATEFTLFPDGSLAKYFPRPDFAPQVLLVDATGAQLGVLRNQDVGELICNALNLLVIASKVNAVQEQAIVQPGSPIILPGGNSQPVFES